MQTAHIDTFARDNLPPRDAWPDLLLDLPELRYPERLNAADVLLAPRFAQHPCVRGDEATWSYAELRERAERIARVLVDDMGLVAGNRVLLHGPNTPELVAAWFGILLAGGVVVATMPLLRARELGTVIAKAQVSHGLADVRGADEVTAAQATNPVLRELLTYGPGGELEQRAAGRPAGFEPVETAAEDVALIAFTSGTTGEPKGCVHMHRDVLATCDTFAARILQPQPDDVFTGTAPVGFTFGLGALVLFPIRFGASLAPIAKPGPDAIVDAIRRRGATTLSTAPTMYRALLRGGAADDLARLRTCVSAGEPLPANVAEQWFETTGVKIIDGIGSTEMLHIFIAARAADVKFGSVGTPVPGYEARVVDEDLRPLPAGTVGRLAVRGPTGCRYLADERQSEYVVGGWNLTGDAFRVDEDGYFFFQARNDDMIVSSGYNISPIEVETALLEHAAVAECAVVAAPDEQRGHVVCAYVVLAEGAAGGDALARELQDHVKEQIAPYKYPRRLEFVDALPRTPTGKVQRSALRERVGRAPISGGAADPAVEMSGITAMPADFTPVVPFDRSFDALYGLEIVEEDVHGRGMARGRVVVREDHLDRHGFVHGGVLASAAEALASRGTALAVIPHGSTAMGLSNDTTTLEPVTSGTIEFEARVVSAANDMWVWAIEARDDARRPCAYSRVTVAVRPAPDS